MQDVFYDLLETCCHKEDTMMKKKKPRKRYSVLFLFVLTLFIAGILFFYRAYQADPLNAMDQEPFYAKKEKMEFGNIPKGVALGSRQQKECRKIYQRDKKLLVLVNREQELPEGYTPTLRTISNGRLSASGFLYDDLRKMLSDAGGSGHQYWIASAWRSPMRQQELVDEDIQALLNKGMDYEEAEQEVYKETQPAGHSEHETGLALDILCSSNPDMTISQEQEPGNRWLRENSWKYGFILRYPKEKEELTQISYEPWHFRYVGKAAAKFMYHHNLCLEEFYQIAVNRVDKAKK